MQSFARREIVDPDQVGIYHCIARCVRRAFLCGMDPLFGKSFDHRKEWVQQGGLKKCQEQLRPPLGVIAGIGQANRGQITHPVVRGG